MVRTENDKGASLKRLIEEGPESSGHKNCRNRGPIRLRQTPRKRSEESIHRKHAVEELMRIDYYHQAILPTRRARSENLTAATTRGSLRVAATIGYRSRPVRMSVEGRRCRPAVGASLVFNGQPAATRAAAVASMNCLLASIGQAFTEALPPGDLLRLPA